MSIDAMKQALEALEQYTNVVTSSHDPNSWVTVADGGKPARDAITALRAAIEQAQEPVAWVCYGSASDEKHTVDYQQEDINAIPVGTMLYTAPRQWQGLTDEEADELVRRFSRYELLRAIEAKLREKNT